MAYGYRINQAGIVKSSHGKPKSVDTYWITEELMAEHARAGLPADDAYFRYILLQIRLNQHPHRGPFRRRFRKAYSF